MKAFADLFREIDQTNSTNEKVELMRKFFATESAETNAWALYLLMGRRPKKLIGSGKLREWVREFTGLPEWLLEESYSAVGDTAEMVSLIVGRVAQPAGEHDALAARLRELPLEDWMEKLIFPLMSADDATKKETVLGWWRALAPHEVFIVNKFLTGVLRVGVSETLTYRALEKKFALPRAVIAARLLGNWEPTGAFFRKLGDPVAEGDQAGDNHEILPKPFCLAAPLEGKPADLGDVREWVVEWKWDGIRCQVVKYEGQVEIWSRGEERVTRAFPDVAEFLGKIPGDWILDGELVAGTWHTPALFQELQKRLNRKKPTAAFQAENPVAFIAYDLLVDGREDLVARPLEERLERLEKKFAALPLSERYGVSPKVPAREWKDLDSVQADARRRGAEGLMLKKKSSVYETGRKRGVWFKWKIDPLTVDAVLTSAQPGTGKRASLYTDYTFSIWKGDQLVPIAKAYSGLTDAEIRSLDAWIRKNTVERFGPVRAVKNERVYEIGFEGLAKSPRHKSGFAVRFPRVLRERTDKKPDGADHVEDMEKLLEALKERDVHV